MKRLVFILLLLIISLQVSSCSDNTGSFQEDLDSCSDNIKNGDESGIDCGGSCPNLCPFPNGLEGEIVINTTLDDFDEYILTGPLLIRDQTTLNIPAGITIKALPGRNAHIAIAQGGRIIVDGTQENPVIFTSASQNPVAGDWGGLLICGFAPVNTGINSRTEITDLFYGGDNSNDSSGSIRYLRVEYTGATDTNKNNFNGISFYGVGSNTRIEHVQVYESLGDGFKMYGGTVNTKWLAATNISKSAISVTNGWNGNSEFNHLTEVKNIGIKIANNLDSEEATPITSGNFANTSMIGPFIEGAFLYTEGGGITTASNIFTSNLNLAFRISGTKALDRVDSNDFQITPIEFSNPTSNFMITNYTGTNDSFYTQGTSLGSGNQENIPEWAIGWTREIN